MDKAITLKEIEKEYNVKFDERGNMKLSTWFKKNGLKSLGKVLEKINKKTKLL